jgi:hypothetical protein
MVQILLIGYLALIGLLLLFFPFLLVFFTWLGASEEWKWKRRGE